MNKGINLYTQVNPKEQGVILAFNENVKEYGTDSIKYCTYGGDVYRALLPKAQMYNGNIAKAITDDTAWIKTDLVYNQHSFNEHLSVLKNGLRLQPQPTGLTIKVSEGVLHSYNPTKKGWDKFSISAKEPLEFKYVYPDGTEEDGTLRSEFDFTKFVEPITNSLQDVAYSNDATYQKIYVNTQGEFVVVRGTVNYTTLTQAEQRYIGEDIPALDGYFYIGGILARKDTTDINSSKALVLQSSKFTEALVGTGSSGTLKLKEPVQTENDLLDISAPEDGEVRQVKSYLNKPVFYIFNTDATEGLAPNDGTIGYWNILKGGAEAKVFEVSDHFTVPDEDPVNVVFVTSNGTAKSVTLPDTLDTGATITVVRTLDSDEKVTVEPNGYDILTKGEAVTFVKRDSGDWSPIQFYKENVNTFTVKAKDQDANPLLVNGESELDISTQNYEKDFVALVVEVPDKKYIKSISATDNSGNSIDVQVIDPYTGMIRVTRDVPTDEIVTITAEIDSIAISHAFMGQLLIALPNEANGIYELNGQTISDAKLARFIEAKQAADSDAYPDFTVDGDSITLPDWSKYGGEVAYTGGYGDDDRGLAASKLGLFVQQGIQRHNHQVWGSQSAASATSGSYGVPKRLNSYSGTTGSDYTRSFGRVTGVWCIIGTQYLMLDADSKVATPVSVTFDGLTVDRGQTTKTIFEGTTSYVSTVDLQPNYILDTENCTNCTVIDAAKGLISYQQLLGGGDFTINLAQKLRPKKYLRQWTTEKKDVNESWAVMKEWQPFGKLAGDVVEISWDIPVRNDQGSSWAGVYHKIDYSIDGGTTWNFIYDSGYHCETMTRANNIGRNTGSMIVDIDEVNNAETVTFRFWAKTYLGSFTGGWNFQGQVEDTGPIGGGVASIDIKVIN